MYTLLVLIATIAAILLIVIVLLQSSKGGGLAGTFGGVGGMGTMFGTRRTADFLSKATWWLAGALAVIALVVNLFFLPGQTTAEQRSVIQESGRQNVPTQPTLPPQNTPPTNE
ncbi:MAG TPA: preprotein translocase subunit SecG [Ignavibacteriaceae bacterium]|jgi:preprotein translocase subunit SecG|nr:MAG: Protein-export membrane protein SecG [Ignavibacteria bacterium ADurb.Bin266]HQF42862.1 preprotein translocase subunit SecG [Ignavibacteriaceae bacterium]HQI40249.1 preprotein translocase subunit SecG [Ignavibacteriaceae bacterium]